MRRKPGAILPIEASILAAALDLRRRGSNHFHGFLIAHEMREGEDARRLTAYGTLYHALDRMAAAGLLTRRWEDPLIAEREGRPRRRLYTLTTAGEAALAGFQAPMPARTLHPQRGSTS